MFDWIFEVDKWLKTLPTGFKLVLVPLWFLAKALMTLVISLAIMGIVAAVVSTLIGVAGMLFGARFKDTYDFLFGKVFKAVMYSYCAIMGLLMIGNWIDWISIQFDSGKALSFVTTSIGIIGGIVGIVATVTNIRKGK